MPVDVEVPVAPLNRPVLSVVVPCFNESAGLLDFHARLSKVMSVIGESWDVLYVNDGSRDLTLPLIEALVARDPRAGLLNLSRNFGKEIALTAGLDHASATGAVIVIDADLQDPPEVIPMLVAQWRLGFEMVYAQRAARSGDSWTKRTTAHGFYRLMQRLSGRVLLPRDTGDFRLIGRRALDALLQLREHHRFMKGLFAWVGFPSVAVSYVRAPRAAGESSWNYWSLWNLAIEGITAFTVVPLKIATYAGLLVALVALLFGGELVVRTLMFGNHVPGYPSLMAVVLFLGGVQLMTLGVIGEYLGRIFNETKRRPLYLVERYSVAGSRQPNADEAVWTSGTEGKRTMADTDNKGLTTEGKPPKSHEDINQPGMTNGVPDEIGQREALGGPSSQRAESETASGNKDADHD